MKVEVDRRDVGENDSIVRFVASDASSEALNDGGMRNIERRSLVENAEEKLGNGLGTSKFFLDEDESGAYGRSVE
jgi:hypothetical protein